MIVSELIKRLQEMPQDAEVYHLWDGEPRTIIEHVWFSCDGDVITADRDMVIYDKEVLSEPKDGDGPWSTPK